MVADAEEKEAVCADAEVDQLEADNIVCVDGEKLEQDEVYEVGEEENFCTTIRLTYYYERQR